MFSDEEQPIEDLAARLHGLLVLIQGREGAHEALASYGISVEGQDDSE